MSAQFSKDLQFVRFRLQFRLRTLMLLMLAAACSVALIAWLGDFGSGRLVARVQQSGSKLLLTTQTQGHQVAIFEAEDEQLVFFFKRYSGSGTFGGSPKILDADGGNLLALDDTRHIGQLLPGKGTFREWIDDFVGHRPQGYQYPIRRGYRGELRFQFSWDYVDEQQNIVLDVTIPWRTDDAR